MAIGDGSRAERTCFFIIALALQAFARLDFSSALAGAVDGDHTFFSPQLSLLPARAAFRTRGRLILFPLVTSTLVKNYYRKSEIAWRGCQIRKWDRRVETVQASCVPHARNRRVWSTNVNDANEEAAPFALSESSAARGKLAHDAAPVPEKVVVAQGAEEVEHHATTAGFSEVGLHGGKLSWRRLPYVTK